MADAVADALSRLVPGGVTRGGLVLGDRTVPPRLRAHGTALQAGLAAVTAKGSHVVVADTGHAIHHEQPGVAAEAIFQTIAKAHRA
jgi:pimeloyl-ACP methyl ester carboxylesterase